MIAGTRVELRLLWRGWVLSIAVVICALFAVANVSNQVSTVQSDYALVQHTRAEYRANGLDFTADLAKPAKVVTRGDEQTVSNLARYDYDTMAAAIVALSPASSDAETLKYFGFVFFPALFFLLGLWMSTVQRRYHFEKVTLARAGASTTVGARQLALLVAAAGILAATLLTDAISRAIATGIESTRLPFASYPPLDAATPRNALAQWGVVVLAILFFGMAGIAIGALVGVFALPAILFVMWDLVVPFLGEDDPRNWFVRLGHDVFDVGSGFRLAAPIAVAAPVALTGTLVGSALLLVAGHVCIRLRNPRAT